MPIEPVGSKTRRVLIIASKSVVRAPDPNIMPTTRFRTDYEVLSRHADPNGRLSAPALVTMLFDAADLHAADWSVSLGQLSKGAQTWVLSRLYLRLDEQPMWNQQISVETWPTGAMRLLAGRDFRIFAERRPVGAATTLWLMIDREARKPVGLPDFIKEFKPPDDSPLVKARGNWPGPKEPAIRTGHTVHWTDLDLNRHANAMAYLRWLLEPVPAKAQDSGRLAELDILFKGESFLDDEIDVLVSELERTHRDITEQEGTDREVTDHEGTELKGTHREITDREGTHRDRDTREFTHSAVRVSDGQILAAARSLWSG